MNRDRIDYLDFAKGYAMAGIVAYHVVQRIDLPAAVQQAAALGGTGVHLFFAHLAVAWVELVLQRRGVVGVDCYC